MRQLGRNILNFPKVLLIGAFCLFGVIGIAGLVKRMANRTPARPQEVARAPKKEAAPLPTKAPAPVILTSFSVPKVELRDEFPNIDRMFQLFTTGPTKLPIVETITYESTVPWLKGRPAWLSDYATHYATSRHFIARCLNGKADYLTQKVFPGSRFNVFRKDKPIQFYLLADLSRCKMGFYYVDLQTKERVLLKTYRISAGRGELTPTGVFTLGNKIAIYKPGSVGLFRDQKVEMVSVFGTRWIPLHTESGSTISCGLHGAPWMLDPTSGKLVENRECIGKNTSDGSIRLLAEDMEELFSIVITKPTTLVIVKDFHEAKLPGIEVATPTR